MHKRQKIQQISSTHILADGDKKLASIQLHFLGFRSTPSMSSRARFNKQGDARLFEKAFPPIDGAFFIEFPQGLPEDREDWRPFNLISGGNEYGGGEVKDSGQIFLEDGEVFTTEESETGADGKIIIAHEMPRATLERLAVYGAVSEKMYYKIHCKVEEAAFSPTGNTGLKLNFPPPPPVMVLVP